MTGTAKVKPPKNNAEWARNTEKRLNSAEHPTSVRIGAWTLSTHPDTGALIASNVNGGSLVLAEQPESSDNPDAIITQGQPFLRVERQQNQSGARGSTILVQWDTVTYQTDEWGFTPTASDIVIPQDGVYLCQYHLAFLNSSNVTNKAVFLVDAVAVMAQELLPGGAQWQSFYMSESWALNAGQIISCGAFVAGSGTMDFGSSGVDTSVHTSLSLLKLPVD